MQEDRGTVEREVLDVLQAWSRALQTRDLDALARCYEGDVRVFDVKDETRGFAELRRLWEACLPYFGDEIGTERDDVRMVVGPSLAVVTMRSRLTGMKTDHPSARSWLRTTVCLHRTGGTWRIFHEHSSLPVDCANDAPVYLLDET